MAPDQLRKKNTSCFKLSGLGVAKVKNKVALFYSTKSEQPFNIAFSDKNGLNFKRINKELSFPTRWPWFGKRPEIKDLRLNEDKKGFLLTFLEKSKGEYQLKYRRSPNLVNWSEAKKIDNISEAGIFIPNGKKEKKLVFGTKEINLGVFKNLSRQPQKITTIHQPSEQILGKTNLKISQIFEVEHGLLFLFYRYQDPTIWSDYSWELLLANKENPEEVIWSKKLPINASIDNPDNLPITPIGSVKINNKLISYWQIGNQEIFAISNYFPKNLKLIEEKSTAAYLFSKPEENPILSPNPENHWESQYTFNPAAICIEDKVHMVYRAICGAGISRFGYATSSNGIDFEFRNSGPIYELIKESLLNKTKPMVPNPFISGASWCGCEDPRLTLIDDTIYMTFTALTDWQPPRVTLSTIKLDDFLKQNWSKWSRPIFISAADRPSKNWVFFPKKINGKFAILHSVSPEISIDYFDNLNELGKTKFITSISHEKREKAVRETGIRGIGPPPLETDKGWLSFFHMTDKKEPHKYKIGAMLLDINNPEKIIGQTKLPVLEPDKYYENTGCKPGIVYTCGAVIKNKNLLIYYGAADHLVCLAKTSVNKFLNELIDLTQPKTKLLNFRFT